MSNNPKHLDDPHEPGASPMKSIRKSVPRSCSIDQDVVCDELATLEHALGGVRMIAATVAHGHAETTRDRRVGADACAALLDLVIVRLRLLHAMVAANSEHATGTTIQRSDL